MYSPQADSTSYRSLTLVAFLLLALHVAASGAWAQGALTNGGNHAGAISTPGEIDEWTFEAGIGDAILLSVGEVPPGPPDPDFRPWIRLRRPDGVEIGSAAGLLEASISLSAPLTGTYTVLVRDSTSNRPGTALGAYLLHFLIVPGTPVVPSGDDGGPMTNGANHAGRIGAPGADPQAHLGDLDPWTFTAAQNDAINLSIGEVLDSETDPDFRPWIRLYGPTGALLDSDAGLLAADINVTAPLSGTYTVVVGDSTSNREASHVGDYLIHLVKTPGTPIVPVDDDGGPMTNGANHPGRIGAPGANPRLHLADLDAWTFTAAQNDAINLSIGEVLDSETDPDFRPWIRLYGPTGALLGSAAGLLAADINVTAPLSGTYTVVVGDSTSNREPSHVGDYLIHLVKTPGSPSVPAGDDGGPMTNGANHPGRIGAPGVNPRLHLADLDAWTFTAAQNDAINLSIGEVLDSETDPDFRPWIRLYGPTGALLGSAAGLLAADINVTAPLSGTYTVVVGDSTSNREPSHVGDYLIHLVKTPGTPSVPAGDDGGPMTNGANHPGRIGAPGANPRLHLADLDAWTFCAVQSTALTINISEVVPSPPDPDFRPWIRLYGPTGVLVGSNSGLVTASINVNAPLSGSYTVVVGDSASNREPSHVGDYVLSAFGITVCPSPPTTANDEYSTTINTPLNVPAPGVLTNDNSNGGGPMTAELVTTATTGALVFNANGGFSFTPPNGFTGPVTFSYRALNAFGPGNVATVTVTVSAGTPPTTTPDSYDTTVGTPLNIAAPGVLANDNSHGHGALSAELMTTASNGVLGLNADGSFAYTPNAGFAGADTFTYRAVSSVGAGNTATVTINVFSTPQPPTGLYASSIAGNTVTLRWTPPATGLPPTGYVLEGGVNPGEVLASIPMGGTTPLYTFAAPTGAFYVRVHTLSGGTRSAASNEIRIFVNVPVAPSAPADLVGLVNGSSIALAWRNTFGGGAPGGVVLDVTGSLTASLPLGLTDSFQFAGVPGGTYTLALRALNAAGSSPSSNAVTLSFPGACSGAPLPPSGFLAYRLGSTVFVLWDPATTGPAPTSFVLNVSGAFTGSLGTPGRALSGVVGPGSYTLSVVAVNACGSSGATAPQTVVVP